MIYELFHTSQLPCEADGEDHGKSHRNLECFIMEMYRKSPGKNTLACNSRSTCLQLKISGRLCAKSLRKIKEGL